MMARRQRHRQLFGRLLVGLALMVSYPTQLVAQVAEHPAPLARDSVAEAARHAGDQSARRTNVSRFFVTGFMGGMLAGGGAMFLTHSDHALHFLTVGTGAALLVTTASSVRDAGESPIPPRVEQGIQAEIREYKSEFRAAYLQRTKKRAQRAAILGSVSGTIVGAAAAFRVLSSILGT